MGCARAARAELPHARTGRLDSEAGGMANNKRLLWLGVVLGVASAIWGEAVAGPVTFTWDPSRATPALISGPAVGHAISLTNYIRNTLTSNRTTLRQTFAGDQIQTINSFTLGGATVSAPGLNSSYGLYFRITPGGSFPINSSGTMIGPPVYSQLDVQLVADVGHDNGSVVDSSAGLGFSNAAGVSNDLVLATGSLLSASMSIITTISWPTPTEQRGPRRASFRSRRRPCGCDCAWSRDRPASTATAPTTAARLLGRVTGAEFGLNPAKLGRAAVREQIGD